MIVGKGRMRPECTVVIWARDNESGRPCAVREMTLTAGRALVKSMEAEGRKVKLNIWDVQKSA